MNAIAPVDKIIDIINEQIRPALATHGGGIDFVAFDEASGELQVALSGMCGGCPHAQATISGMVEAVICESVPEVKSVVRV